MNLRSFSTLQIALGASFAVHAALLTVRFIDPEGTVNPITTLRGEGYRWDLPRA